jgi:hypothetical protein
MIRYRGTKYIMTFDEVFDAGGVAGVPPHLKAPKGRRFDHGTGVAQLGVDVPRRNELAALTAIPVSGG